MTTIGEKAKPCLMKVTVCHEFCSFDWINFKLRLEFVFVFFTNNRSFLIFSLFMNDTVHVDITYLSQVSSDDRRNCVDLFQIYDWSAVSILSWH